MKSYTSPELIYAVSSKFYKSGKRSAATLLKESNERPKRANKIIISFNNILDEKPIPNTIDEALAFIIEN